MALVVEQGRPMDETGRLAKEIRIYDLLDQLGIAFDRIDHRAVATMEDCDDIDAALAPAVICKNLFLCNKKKTQFYLFLIEGAKRYNASELSKQLGCSRLSFAPAEYMEQFMDITPGSASVMGLMNDTGNKIQLIVDEDVLHAEFFSCHPCINTSSIRLKSTDVFETFVEAVHHPYWVVKAQ